MRAVQALAGFVANDPEEAVYLNVSQDQSGAQFDGSKCYELRFAQGQQPKVDAFWSLTMYDLKYNLVANSIDRYSLGDRNAMTIDDDGSLPIYIQHATPGPAAETNWLPALADGFFLILRAYMPHAELREQTWKPPFVEEVACS